MSKLIEIEHVYYTYTYLGINTYIYLISLKLHFDVFVKYWNI